MKKILNITSSPRGAASSSIQLANVIIDKLRAAHPDAVVETVDLVNLHFPHLEESHLTSFFTPAEKHSAADKAAIRHSDQMIRSIQEADILVIGAPMYNFSIHSTLKAWIDHIVRSGVTFRVSEGHPEGLIKGKKVYVAISSGGIYSEGPMKSYDFIEPYLRFILGFIGLTDMTFFRAEGFNVPGIKETAMEKAAAAVTVD
jgi:FMN-dependent NADH-azoreductase